MKKTFTIILAAVMLLTALTACKPSSNPDATQAPSQEPSAQVTQDVRQSEEPTAEPTEKPVSSYGKYNKYECDELRKFFDAPCGDGSTTNGLYLNPAYVSEDPATWSMSNGGENFTGKFISIGWTDDGHVSSLSFGNISDDKENKVELGGMIELDGFERISHFSIINSKLEKVTFRNCPDLWGFDFMDSVITKFDIRSERFGDACQFGDLSGGLSSLDWFCFDRHNLFDLTLSISFTDGSPIKPCITCTSYKDEDGDYLYITARPPEGYRFDGWYDESGNLISAEERYDFPNEDSSIVGIFHYTARFTKE